MMIKLEIESTITPEDFNGTWTFDMYSVDVVVTGVAYIGEAPTDITVNAYLGNDLYEDVTACIGDATLSFFRDELRKSERR